LAFSAFLGLSPSFSAFLAACFALRAARSSGVSSFLSFFSPFFSVDVVIRWVGIRSDGAQYAVWAR
jgi:hypothetical protein